MTRQRTGDVTQDSLDATGKFIIFYKLTSWTQ